MGINHGLGHHCSKMECHGSNYRWRGHEKYIKVAAANTSHTLEWACLRERGLPLNMFHCIKRSCVIIIFESNRKMSKLLHQKHNIEL